MSKLSLRKVKPTYKYTVQELADCFCVTKRYIYLLIEHQDLPVCIIDNIFHVYGKEFIEFEKNRRMKRKIKNNNNELLCFGCQKFQVPLNKKVKIINIENNQNTTGIIRIVGICPKCGKEIGKISNKTKIDEISNVFKIVEKF